MFKNPQRISTAIYLTSKEEESCKE